MLLLVARSKGRRTIAQRRKTKRLKLASVLRAQLTHLHREFSPDQATHEHTLGRRKRVALSLFGSREAEAEASEQTDGTMIFGLNGGVAFFNAISRREMLEHRPHRALRIPAAPVSACQDIRDMRTSTRCNGRLHVAHQRLALRTNHPIQPRLASIG